MCPKTPTLQDVSSSNKLAQDKIHQAAAQLLFHSLRLSAGGSRARRSCAPTLSQVRECHLASVCSLFKQRGVWDLDMRSHLSQQIDASLLGTLQSFSRAFSLNANIGIMKEPECLLLSFMRWGRRFSLTAYGTEYFCPFAWLHTAIKCKKSNNPQS